MRWVSFAEGLPRIIYSEDGSVNSVLTLYKKERVPDCGSIYQVSNTIWANNRGPTECSHWMPLPETPND